MQALGRICFIYGSNPSNEFLERLFKATLGRYLKPTGLSDRPSFYSLDPDKFPPKPEPEVPLRPLDLSSKLKLIQESDTKHDLEPLSIQFRTRDGSIKYRTFKFCEDCTPELNAKAPVCHKKSGTQIVDYLSQKNDAESRLKLEEQRAQLIVSAANLNQPERYFDWFCEKVWALEKRLQKRKPELSDLQIAEMFRQITRLFSGLHFNAYSARERLHIGSLILTMALRPQDISQGNHKTCNVTVIENRLFTLEPELASRFIADLVVEGRFNTIDGSKIYMSEEMLEADSEAKSGDRDGLRNLCSMIFQRAAANVYWQRQTKCPDGTIVPKGSITYQQFEKDGKSCERLLNMADGSLPELKNKKGLLVESPDLNLENIMDVLCQISHHVPHLIVIMRGRAIIAPKAGLCTIASAEHLHEILAGLSGDRAFPVFASFPNHILVIRDYDPERREVSLDNSYTRGADFLGIEEGSNPRKRVEDVYREMGNN